MIAICVFSVSSANALPVPERASEMVSSVPHKADMKPDTDGNLEKGEYEIITPNGAVTRAFCPYTCDMRGLPASRCKAWPSASEPEKCYVQDTSMPSDPAPGMAVGEMGK